MTEPDPFDSFPFLDPNDSTEGLIPDPASDSMIVHVLLSGETGVSFDALVLFAEPMFDLYGMEATDAFALKGMDSYADPELITVLSSSRVLWAYFSMSPKERSHKLSLLAAHLVGDHPNEEDWLEIEALLEAVEPYWSAMLPEEIRAAQSAGHQTLGFDELLEHPAFQMTQSPETLSFGTESLSEVEARALFAQPLLEDPDVLVDPVLFEAAIERANAYWQLATVPESQREESLCELISQFSRGDGSPDSIRDEARAMVDRFHVLFPRK